MNVGPESTQLERMERVLTWWLASLVVFDGEQKKPFAPVVGEQFCCEFLGSEGGDGAIRFYAEQVRGIYDRFGNTSMRVGCS